MTIYHPPKLDEDDLAIIALIEEQKQRLRFTLAIKPLRWSGWMRRNATARNIQGSNTIEGYNASIDDAIAAVEKEDPLDTKTETWLEIVGYRKAMDFILQLADDAHFEFHPMLIRSLHFMMTGHSLNNVPGLWRNSTIYVYSEVKEENVYEGAPVEQVAELMRELFDYLNEPSECPIVVKAAMAHLNLTMVHPFKDGNGRMARALQTLVLSRDGMLSPVFSSIEEWLGRNTPEYYEILSKVGKGKWNPKNDAHEWIRFCLRAHYQQAATQIRRNEWAEIVSNIIGELIEQYKLNDRMFFALIDAAFGLRVVAGRYAQENSLSSVVASRDLKKLTNLELLIPHGERRGRFYTGAQFLKEIAIKEKPVGRAPDPYELVRQAKKEHEEPSLPFDEESS